MRPVVARAFKRVAALVVAVLVISGLSAVPAANAVGFTISGHVDLGVLGASAGNAVKVSYAWPGGTGAAFNPSSEVFADSAGNYRITGLVEQDYSLYFRYVGSDEAFAPQYWGNSSTAAGATYFHVGADTPDMNIVLPEYPATGGNVSFGASGNHPAGVTAAIRVRRDTGYGWSGPDTRAVTDANGNYSLRLGPGTYQIYAQNVDYQTANVPGNSGGATPFNITIGSTPTSLPDITMNPWGSISGHVDLGNPANPAGAGAVKVHYLYCGAYPCIQSHLDPFVLTDASGNFSIPKRSNATYSLYFRYVAGTEYQSVSGYTQVTVSNNSNTVVPTKTLLPSASISGRVFLGTSSNPAGSNGVTVTATRVNPDWLESPVTGSTDASGNYLLVGLRTGYYRLAFHYTGGPTYVDQWWSNSGTEAGSTLVSTGASFLAGYNATLQQGASFSGVLKNTSGVAVAGRQVIAHRYVAGNYAEQGQYSVNSASDGSFTMSGLPEGRYFVEVYDGLIEGPYGRQWIGGTAYRPQPEAIDLVAGQQHAFGDVTVARPAYIGGVVTCDTCGTDLEPPGLGATLYAQDPSGGWVYAGAYDVSWYPGGGYQFYRLLPGTYQIRAGFGGDAGGYVPYVSEPFQITEGQQLTRDDIVLTRPTGSLAFGSLVKSSAAGSTAVYLVDGGNTLVPVTSVAIAADAGISSAVTSVAPSLLVPYSVHYRVLSNVITCGTVTYVASGGKLWPVDPGLLAGLVPTALSTPLCATLPKSATTVSGALLLKSTGGGATYFITPHPFAPTFAFAPAKRQVISEATTRALAAPYAPITLPVSSAFLDTLATGPKLLPIGAMVRGPSMRVYFVAGFDHLVPILSYDTTASMGLPSTFTTVTQADIDQATVDPDTSPLTNTVVCNGQSYFAGSGKLWPVTGAQVAGLPQTQLDASACSVLTKSALAIAGPLFVQSAPGGAVFQIMSDGSKRQLTGRVAMRPSGVVLTVAASFLASRPSGPPIAPLQLNRPVTASVSPPAVAAEPAASVTAEQRALCYSSYVGALPISIVAPVTPIVELETQLAECLAG